MSGQAMDGHPFRQEALIPKGNQPQATTSPTDNPTSEQKRFIPGFETVQEALAAGQSFFAKTNGAKGRYQRDFHIVSNEHGRFHFAEGPKPSPSTTSPQE
jgi:hypothetical protein